jgi:hypothetical protein
MALSAMSRRHQTVAPPPPSSIVFRTYAGTLPITNFNFSLGMHITIATGKKLILTHLGTFAPEGLMPASGVNVVTKVARFDAQSTILAEMTFTSADTAFLDATNRTIIKPLASPIEVAAGVLGIWTYRESGFYAVYSSASGPHLAVNYSIAGITVGATDYYDIGGNNFPSGTTIDQYGGSTWAGYTVDV